MLAPGMQSRSVGSINLLEADAERMQVITSALHAPKYQQTETEQPFLQPGIAGFARTDAARSSRH
jgi:hypothetical protein